MPQYAPLTKFDLRERIKEIEARIKQMDRREKALDDLKKWLASRKLQPADLGWMLRQMKPKRAAKAVKSKKPLQPPANRTKPLGRHGDAAFCTAIFEARKQKGWTTEETGKKINVSSATISGWERGRYAPKEPMRQKIVKLFGLDADLGKAASAASALASAMHKKVNGAGATA